MSYSASRPPRIAIAHDYLTQRGGAEKVVLAMARAFPEAPIHTMLFDPPNTYSEFGDLDIRSSRLNRIGPLRENHRAALPLLPLAASSINIDADIVLTSSSGWAHGFRTNGRKLVYCYSPARWLYQKETYLGESSSVLKRAVLGALSPGLRRWDSRAAATADRYMAISTAVQARIEDAYGIDSTVVAAPFTDDDRIESDAIATVEHWLGGDDFYLCVSRLLPYKNVDRVMKAFVGTNRKLIIVGRGPEGSSLAAMRPDNVLMLSDLSDGQMKSLYSGCKAVVAASYEDYGLTPLEAGYHGKPSAVLRWGGFLDTIDEGVSGVYFDEPEPHLIAAALTRLESMHWDSTRILGHIEQFTEKRFAATLHGAVDEMASSARATPPTVRTPTVRTRTLPSFLRTT